MTSVMLGTASALLVVGQAWLLAPATAGAFASLTEREYDMVCVGAPT